MEKGKLNEESEISRALESIHFGNQDLQQYLKKIVTTRKLLEDKWDSVASDLSLFTQEERNLQDSNLIICEKIHTAEKEAVELEKSKKYSVSAIKNLKTEIKEYKESFDMRMDVLVIAAEKLCAYFLLALSNNEAVKEECLIKLVEDLDKVKEKIMGKENHVAKLKQELEECDCYDFLEDPMESEVTIEERQFVMDILENNLVNAKQQLEDMYKLKSEKEIEESEV